MASQWRTVLQVMYRTPFGVTDPVFGRDIGYYVFALPAIELVLGFAFSLVIALAVPHRAADPLSPAPGRARR